ncbi:MAG: YtxH domain-containing protein [Coriobacteriia bacterium]|nr:YtxH domain-containing protein [Coriobacteriia bacterium]
MAKGKIIAFFVGGAIGATVALLFAPRSGKETRAIITDKAEEVWGEGAQLYAQGFERIKTEAANVQKTAAQANEELRSKIENARTAIAEQIAKNAQTARDAINSRIPLSDDKITQEADVVKGQLDDAAQKVKTAAADLAATNAAAISNGAAAAAEKVENRAAGAQGKPQVKPAGS